MTETQKANGMTWSRRTTKRGKPTTHLRLFRSPNRSSRATPALLVPGVRRSPY
jgi:hypothetical protein